MHPRQRLWTTAAAIALAACLAAPRARANGRCPEGQYALVGPGPASSTIAVLSTFGILLSQDGGANFYFICEEQGQYTDFQDPALGLGADGTLLIGGPDENLLHMRDHCAEPTSDAMLRYRQVTDLAADATGTTVIAAVNSNDSPALSWIAISHDGGFTFDGATTQLAGVSLTTAEIAPSQSDRIYATGTSFQTGQVGFYRCNDGVTLDSYPVPFAAAAKAEIAGVDPTNPDVVYFRVQFDGGTDAGSSTALIRTADGGLTFREVARGDQMRGFALADDGRTVWYGDAYGVYASSDDGADFTLVNRAPVTCLRYHSGTLYACGTYPTLTACSATTNAGDFILGRSVDNGRTFTPVVTPADVRGPFACTGTTPEANICPARWATVSANIEATSDAVVIPDAGPASAPACNGCTVGARARHDRAAGVLGILAFAAAYATRRRPR